MTFPIAADLLRGVYVEVATAEASGGPIPVTDSRLSVLTGIHRKELRRQRLEPDRATPDVVTLNSQLIARWLGDPAYLDATGAPLPLPRAGPAPSVEALVESATRDVRPRAVLDAWLAQGVAFLAEDGRVVLQARAFVPGGENGAQLYYFARNLHDHAAAAAANVLAGRAPPFLERSLHYDQLGPEAANALAEAARQAAQSVLVDVNRTAVQLADNDTAAGQGRRRVNFGVYVYAEDEPDAV